MNPLRGVNRLLPIGVALAALALGGCKNIFVPKHKVLVDAITAPGVGKPTGLSYRLVARRSTVGNVPVQVPVVKACLDAALTSAGLFEAPPNAPSDIFIEVGFGQDSTPRVDPAARETYLQLSARTNPDRSTERATGPEIWDVRVALLGVSGRIESAMPLLSSVAVEYMATDTHKETRVDVPQNSPVVAAVRENAIKSLDRKAGVNQAPAPDPNAPVGAETAAPPKPSPGAAALPPPVK
jgi:hypothetical protein